MNIVQLSSVVSSATQRGAATPSGAVNTSPATTGSTAGNQASAGAAQDPKQLQHAIDAVNRRLSSSSMKVVLDSNAPANQLWLNVVDQTTGQVVQKFPPEGLRKFLDSSSLAGMSFDGES